VNTTAIGLFPLIIAGVTSLKRHEKSNQEIAESIQIPVHQTDQQKIILSNQHGEDLHIPANELLYIEAMQNYVAVYHLKNDTVVKTLLRNTLKSLLQSVSMDSFFRCHRSFAVNLDHVNDISGNSQGLTLSLKQAPEITIPVSRKYIPDLKNELKEMA
jgi:DNA-binding LytR/AlgR family response regulator